MLARRLSELDIQINFKSDMPQFAADLTTFRRKLLFYHHYLCTFKIVGLTIVMVFPPFGWYGRLKIVWKN